MQGSSAAPPGHGEPGPLADAAGSKSLLRDRLDLWDWRRRIHALYADLRAADPLAGWTRWRSVRDALFRDHPQSPLPPEERAAFPGLACFPYDPGLRLTVPLVAAGGSEILVIPVADDEVVRLQPFARTDGLAARLGGELTLYWLLDYGGGVFLPFRDATGGAQSYAGGRYLLDTAKGADLGRTADGLCILDFNFAYNPSCSYSERWVCPLAPAENTLPGSVRGGERYRDARGP